MATTHRPRQAGGGHATPASTRSADIKVTAQGAVAYVWAIARLFLGWTFLWAFLDKLVGLGHETPAAKGWLDGGSPTKGFLTGSPKGAFASFYHNLVLIGLALAGAGDTFGFGRIWGNTKLVRTYPILK